MSQHPSMEHILGLPEPPPGVCHEIETLADRVYERLTALSECLDNASLPVAHKTTLQGEVRDAMSAFHELQLYRACQLDDLESWGEAWKQYAWPAIPVEHRVRLRLEGAGAAKL